jgi:hypothetical protein
MLLSLLFLTDFSEERAASTLGVREPFISLLLSIFHVCVKVVTFFSSRSSPYYPPAFHPSQSLQHPTGTNSVTLKMRQHLHSKRQDKRALHSVRSAEDYPVRNARRQRL